MSFFEFEIILFKIKNTSASANYKIPSLVPDPWLPDPCPPGLLASTASRLVMNGDVIF